MESNLYIAVVCVGPIKGVGTQLARSSSPSIRGNVKTRTDAKGKVTTTAYDAQNRMVSTTDRLGGVTLQNYNCCQLVSLVDAEGKSTSYGYYQLGRRISVTLPDNTTNAGRNIVALAT